MFTIEKNIPITTDSLFHTGLTNFVRSMAIGDSFLCPAELQSRIHCLARQGKMKVKTKREDALNLRVWRIE